MIQLVLGLALAATKDDSWIWWAPPVHFTNRDRLGYSDAQILKMGIDKWAKLVYKSRGKLFGAEKPNLGESDAPLAITREGSTVVWAACLRDRNNSLMSHWPAEKRGLILGLQEHMFRFGMACIALEDILAGGGTYVNHYPQFMWNSEQKSIYSIIRSSRGPSIPADTVERIDRRLTKYTTIKKTPNRILADSPADVTEVHHFARIALEEHSVIQKISNGLNQRQRNSVLEFEKSYLIDYLGIRGADGTRAN